ncbi:MAG: hypothetical protein AB7C90_02505 [Bacteroidales bacterium]
MKTNIKEIVLDWLKTKNFDEGVEILFAYRPQMARIFRGRQKTYAGKLEYELKKLGGIARLQAVVHNTPAIKTLTAQTGDTEPPAPPAPPVKKAKKTAAPKAPGTKKGSKPAAPPKAPATAADIQPDPGTHPRTDTPDFIRKIVKEHARLFKLRSQLDDKRAAIPQKNHPKHNKDRKVLSESIQQISGRIEQLFNAKEDYYEKGVKPDMALLFPAKPAEDPQPDKPAPKKARKSKKK